VSVDVLNEIAAQARVCQKCALQYSRKNAVAGNGPADSEIMFIGEAPGFHENEKGLPFVGAAGKFLDELLEGCGLSRERVFITNVVKCRPPGNRDPQPEELSACSNYLDRQIEAIDPLVIVTLGRFSMARYLPDAKISDIHGQPKWIHNRLIVPMYHPAAALHQPKWRPVLLEDFARLPEFIKDARKNKPLSTPKATPTASGGTETNDDEPEQLSLF
jgi:uracil-DNA glycosylase family 4